MPTEPAILIVGAGGHAKVVVEAIWAIGPTVVVVLDDSSDVALQPLLGISVGCPATPPRAAGAFHVAIGGNPARARKSNEFFLAGLRPTTVIHPMASASPSATVELGAFIAAHAVLGPQCTIGAGSIVNHGAVVDHDCTIGEFAHVAPNATLCGGVCVGRLAFVGAGATILPGVRIGAGARVGVGAVVLRDVPDGHCVVGVPARAI